MLAHAAEAAVAVGWAGTRTDGNEWGKQDSDPSRYATGANSIYIYAGRY